MVASVATTLSVSIFFLDEVRDTFKARYTLYFHTYTTQALRPRAPVWLAGQPVGIVRDLEFLPPGREGGEGGERLRVELRLEARVQPIIMEGSAAQVITSGLVGETVVNIVPSSRPGEPLPDGGQLPTAEELDPFEVTRRLRSFSDSIEPVAARWRALRDVAVNGNGTLARFRRNSAELDLLRARLSELGAMLDTLGLATGGLADMLSDEEVRAAFRRLGPRLASLSDRVNDSPLRRAAERGERGEIAANFRGIAERAAAIQRRLDDGDGTLGRLMYDEALLTELRRTREMLAQLRGQLGPRAGGTSGPGR